MVDRGGGGGGGGIAALLLSALLLSAPRGSSAQRPALHELTTTYEGGWIQDGVMFDVRVDPVDGLAPPPGGGGISVRGLDVLTPSTGTLCLEVYTRSGPYGDAPSDPDRWTFLGSFDLDGRGATTPTALPVGAFDPLPVAVGETRAFYVTTQDERLRYTALTSQSTGDVFSLSTHTSDDVAVDADGTETEAKSGLAVSAVVGVAKNYPFAESWPDRVFNGAVIYTLGDEALELTDGERAAAEAARRGLVTCDAPAATSAPVTSAPVTSAPVASPSESPVSPIVEGAPTAAPTTLLSTVRKVATTLSGGLKQSGLMFDIYVPSVEQGGPAEGITVLSFEVSTDRTDEVCVEVYSKDGTHVGFEGDASEGADGAWTSPTWSSLGASSQPGMGEDAATKIPVGSLDPVHVPAGERRAFYVTTADSPDLRYTEPRFNEKTGDAFSTSPLSHMVLYVGSAVAYPFAKSEPSSIFNGAVVYAVGDVGDGKYNPEPAAGRRRTCSAAEGGLDVVDAEPAPGEPSPPAAAPASESSDATTVESDESEVESDESTESAETVSTVADLGGDVDDGEEETDQVSGSDSEGDSPAESASGAETATPPIDDGSDGSGDGVTDEEQTNATPAPSSGATTVPEEDSPPNPPPRPEGLCPSTTAEAFDGSTNVVVGYRYAILTGDGEDVGAAVSEIENVIQRSLLRDKCQAEGVTMMRRARMLQDGAAAANVEYLAFSPNPADEVSGDGCGGEESLPPVPEGNGQVCSLIEGRLTASIPPGADEEAARDDVEASVEAVLSDPGSFAGLPVESVSILASDATSDPSGGNGLVFGEATEGEQGTTELGSGDGKSGDGKNGGLSTTLIAVIAAAGGVVLLSIVALAVVLVRRRGRKRRDAEAGLFQEFPDEEFTPPSDYSDNFAPRAWSGLPFSGGGSSMKSSGSRPPPPSTPPPGIILNELDEISLASNRRSKFAPSQIAAPGSTASGGSGGSHRSVEFIRAGQSFSSRSHQPEDTVDL